MSLMRFVRQDLVLLLMNKTDSVEAWTAYRDAITQFNSEARLLAVSKGRPIAAIELFADLGQRDFAESYWQEASEKISVLSSRSLVWHFIGRLQSNKCAEIAKHCDWVHSLCDVRHARALNHSRPDSRPPLSVCLQVNVTGEASKAGVSEQALYDLAKEVEALPRLALKGLMTMLPKGYDETQQRDAFLRCAQWRDTCEKALGVDLPELSMGMTQDYQQALLAGATWVRIGSGLFREPEFGE